MAESIPELVATDAPAADLPKTKEKLEELVQKASIQYKLKDYATAADHYADAVEIQAELNGEMAPENAELLFYYGRALYKVAISKSDVLGTKVAQEESKKPKKEKKVKEEPAAPSATNGAKAEKKEDGPASKPFFQLTGDENWTDSEDEEDEDGAGEQAEEDQDDFGNAYEVFEMARVLYTKQLEALESDDSSGNGKGKGKAEITPEMRAIKEKLADCHGLLVEIAFENERFHDALPDARAALALQEELHPLEHENVNEAHYSLSLALEFASVAKVREQQSGQAEGEQQTEGDKDEDVIDWDLRNEAAKHTELAIDSLEARLKIEAAAVASDELTPEQKKEKEAIITDKKSILEDLKARLTDLKQDPTKQQYDSVDPSVFQGLLGGLLGADPTTQQAKLAEATQSANDISGLVKTKKKAPAAAPAPAPATDASSSKRKLEVEEDGMNGKRAKTEEMQ